MGKLKQTIKNITPNQLILLRRKVRNIFVRLETLEKNQLEILKQKYNDQVCTNTQKSIINNQEFKIFSQNGEDGILLYIFSKIGTTNKKFVEFGIEEGKECNTANLSINFGWTGLLMEGNKEYAKKAQEYYDNFPQVKKGSVKVLHTFVTKENINEVLSKNAPEREIDLLSLDIDGNDYWVWKEIDTISPRVVAIEYNGSIPAEKSITVKYDSSFKRLEKHSSGYYHGASLKALTKLGEEKGYILVGCDSTGCNAFYVKKEEAAGKLEKLEPEEAFYPLVYRLPDMSLEKQFNTIKNLDFVEI